MICIIDYGMGNLRSVYKAFEFFSSSVKIIKKPSQIKAADKLVLPGVGAFGEAVKNLKEERFYDDIKNFIEKGKPFLGICLGLQLLFEKSAEAPHIEGLGVFKGKIVKFKEKGKEKKLTVPHMGWNITNFIKTTPFNLNIENPSYFYFVHSYYAVPENKNIILAETNYGGNFCAAAAYNNVYAVQFHPEKSQKNGLKLIENFVLM